MSNSRFAAEFAADVPADQARLMAVTRRCRQVEGASHLIMVLHAPVVAALLDEASRSIASKA